MTQRNDPTSENETIKRRAQSEENNSSEGFLQDKVREDKLARKRNKKQKKFYSMVDKIYDAFPEFQTPQKTRSNSIVIKFESKSL